MNFAFSVSLSSHQVQLMAGVNPFVFWLTNFAWDFIVYFGIALVYAVLIYIFDTRQNHTMSNLIRSSFTFSTPG